MTKQPCLIKSYEIFSYIKIKSAYPLGQGHWQVSKHENAMKLQHLQILQILGVNYRYRRIKIIHGETFQQVTSRYQPFDCTTFVQNSWMCNGNEFQHVMDNGITPTHTIDVAYLTQQQLVLILTSLAMTRFEPITDDERMRCVILQSRVQIENT